MLKIVTPILMLLLFILSSMLLEERKLFDLSSLKQINPTTHTQKLIQKKKYREAEEYLSFFMQYDYVKKNPKAVNLLKTIQEKRNSYGYQTEKFFEGIIKGGSDENIGKGSAIASDFLVVGDLRDLSIEGYHYLNHKEVDGFMVSLSSLGLVATATTIYTAGATAPFKTSVSVLKYGKKINKIPKWLQSKIIDYAEVVKKSKSLDKLSTLLEPIYKLYQKVGLGQTLTMLKTTKNAKELNYMVTFASRFGKATPALLSATNRTALAYAKQMPKVSQKSFLYASTYGENGLKGLNKLGEAKFMKRVKVYSNFTKSAYKGNFNPIWNWLLKNIPSTLLFGTLFLSLFYFITKLYMSIKRIG